MTVPNDVFLWDVVDGLSRPQKTLPCKYFYDERGSQLFEEICDVAEYYPTRTERAILRKHASEMADMCGREGCLIEPGAGSGEKTRIILEAFETSLYVPVDISGDYLDGVAAAIAADFPRCDVRPLTADFTSEMTLPEEASEFESRTLFFPGSTLGNFEPKAAADLLKRWRPLLGQGGHMLVGLDLVKDAGVLEAAYDDAAGVTARFNKNLLVRMQDELDASVDPDAFTHRSVFNAEDSRVEMHLVSTREQTVRVGGRTFHFEAGETIHTENSHKFTDAMVADVAANAGLKVTHVWTDGDRLFSVQLLSLA